MTISSKVCVEKKLDKEAVKFETFFAWPGVNDSTLG